MKHIIFCLTLLTFFGVKAQQINPVPDYVFKNQMSVGRNAVTDTAAYFSIGPRFGATKGMMPPMVTDTASMSATKRNGLLIFSIQKNKYLYWDSIGAKWAEMAGTAGSAITGSGVAGYMPEFTTATNIDTTRLYHSAGRFAIGSTTTTNGVFNVYGGQAYFDTSLKVGTQTLLADEGKNEVYVNTTADSGDYSLQVGGNLYADGDLNIKNNSFFKNGGREIMQMGTAGTTRIYDAAPTGGIQFYNQTVYTAILNASGELLLGAPSTDLGSYRLQVAGNTYFNAGTNLDLLVRDNGGVLHMEAVNDAATSNVPFRVYGSPINLMGGAVKVNTLGTFNDAVYKLVVNTGTNRNIGIGSQSGEVSIESFNDALSASAGLRIYGAPTQFFGGDVLINTSTDAGAYALQVAGAIYNTTTITTGAPTGGSIKPWRLGEAATVSPTSPNRTIRVEIDGVVYYIHAKTTND